MSLCWELLVIACRVYACICRKLEQKTKISVHAETYCYRIVSTYVYTPASRPKLIYKPLLTGKASTTLQSAAFIAMYLAVICAFEPVPFRKIMTAPLLHTYKCPDSVLKCFHDIISGIGMWKIWYEFLW